MNAPSILVAGLFHETNTFAPGRTGIEAFEIKSGEALWSLKGEGSPMGAFLEQAAQHGWHVIPSVYFRAMPGPIVTDEVIALFWRQLASDLGKLTNGPLDAIFLVLHGAMISETMDDVEGALLARIAATINRREIPIFGVLDLHANFTPAMAEHSHALLAYRENPHTDAAETAVRSCDLLARFLATGAVPRTAFVPTSVVWPPTGTGTRRPPMSDLEQLARDLERGGILAVNVCAGFAQADTPFAGVGFSMIFEEKSDTAAQIVFASEKLREQAWALRDAGQPGEWDLDQAVATALRENALPTCIVEPADNIGGGAAGDGTSVLRAFLRHDAQGAGVILNAPEAVAALGLVEPGSSCRVEFGGITDQALSLDLRLISRSNGRFELEDRKSHLAGMQGSLIEMGPCALTEAGGVKILLTSRRTPPFDLAQWRSQGVAPETLTLIGIKAAVAHQRAYDPICKASYTVRTPGPCTSDLSLLPYRKIRRPVWPLDRSGEFAHAPEPLVRQKPSSVIL